MASEPISADMDGGVQLFDCQMCGDCCRGYGGTYVSDEDIVAIADYVGMEPERFRETCCRMSGDRPVLAQGDSGYCLFWDRLCTIHPVKPAMCRAWPYIASVLVDVQNWHSMATCCPGMRTDLPDEVIRDRVRRRRPKGS